MKKKLGILLLVFGALLLIPYAASAETYEQLTYRAYADHIEITGCAENAVTLDIPAKINGLPVTNICLRAFYGCSSLTSVNIPAGVTWIGGRAFYGCSSLTSVNIPKGVTSIDESAFYGCSGLTSINIPASVTWIGASAFYGCSGLTSVNIPAGVTTIGEGAFSGCRSLNVEVSPQNNNYLSVDGVLFNKDKTIILAYSKDKIQTAYAIPNSVTSIGGGAFSDCSGLISINIPGGVTRIGDDAFYGCSGLTSVNIPDGVTIIERYAFSGCRDLTSVNIPDGVIGIYYSAFSGCRSLTSINIPDSVTGIGDFAFSGCGCLNIEVSPQNNNYSSVDGVLFNKDKTIILAYTKDKILTTYTVPNGVKSIGFSAFSGCSGLTNVNIPDSVTSIGYWAFDECSSLTSVYYGGSKEEWNNIEIGGYNEPLLDAEIYYNNRLTKSVVDINGENIFFKTSLNDLSETEKQNSEAFVVLYNEGGAVIDSYNAVYDGSEISGVLKNSDSADHIKVFVWNKDGSLEPIINVPEYISL